MSIRIVCEHCSGELQVPRESAGKKIRCPMCGTVFLAAAAAPVGARSGTSASPSAPATWSPVSEEELDDPIPWYILIGAIAPAGLLAFVAHEPIAFAVAAVLVMIGLFVATRRQWSRWSRFMGVASLALLGFAAAAAVNLYAHGSFAELAIRNPFAGGNDAPAPPNTDFAQVAWNEISHPDSPVKLLLPGTVGKAQLLGHPSGMDIHVLESKFPRDGVAFGLRTFKIPTQNFDERGEKTNLDKLHEIVPWIFPDADVEMVKKDFYFDHPCFDYEFFVYDRVPGPAGKLTTVVKATVVVRAFLLRDRAYLLSVAAEKFEPIKPHADRFLNSFRLTQPVEAMRTPSREAEPDWKALGRPPIPRVKPLASFRGHNRPPIMLLAFSRDGKTMLTGSAREHVITWDLESGHGKRLVGAEGYPFYAISPGGKEIVAAVPAGTAVPAIWFFPLDIAAPELGPANTDLIGFSADFKTAFVALETQITAWETVDVKVETPKNVGFDLVKSSKDAKATSQLWHRSAGDRPIACMTVSRDGRLLASAVTASLPATTVKEGKLGTEKVSDAAAKAKDQAPKSPTIKLIDAVKRGDLKTWPAHNAGDSSNPPIQQLAFAPGNKSLASAGIDTTAKIWDLIDRNHPKLLADLMHVGEQQGVSVSSVEYSNDGKVLATGDFSGVVRLWDTTAWKLLHEFRACEASQSVQMMRFSPDDAKLAVAVEMGLGRAGVNLFEIKSLPPAAETSPSIGSQQTEEPPLFNKGK
jgi:WD40 repeat protein